MSTTPAASVAAFLFLLTLQGCVTYRPDPLVPEQELEALRARGTEPLPEPAPDTVPTEWIPLAGEIELEDGLSLGEAATLALFYGPRVREARTAAGVSSGQLLQAGLLGNPELAFGPRFTSDPTDVILGGVLLFEVPLGGRLGADRDRAAAELQAARLEVMAVELETLVEVRRLFLRVHRLEMQRRLVALLEEESGTAWQWAARLEEAGEASPLAASLAHLEYVEVRQELHEVEAACAAARAELLETVGLLATTPLEVAVDAGAPALPPLPAPEPESVLGHPRLRLREAAYHAAEQALRLEVARQYPDLRIGPDYEYDQGESSLGFGIVLDLPLFDRNRGGIAAAEARRDAARDAYRAELLRLGREEATARARREASLEMYAHYRSETLPEMERAESGIAGRLRGGQSDILELVEARRAVARAKLRSLEIAESVDRATLDAAFAGGFILPRTPEGPEGEAP